MDDSTDKPKTGPVSYPLPLKDTDANPVGRDAQRSNGDPTATPGARPARGRGPLFGS